MADRFQSTRPSRASTLSPIKALTIPLFQSTRPSRASTQVLGRAARHLRISIHKALAGLDYDAARKCTYVVSISIHKALAGLDESWRQSAHPLWLYFNPQGPRGPRQDKVARLSFFLYFNPQGPRGPRRELLIINRDVLLISIHKALAGLDLSTRELRL